MKPWVKGGVPNGAPGATLRTAQDVLKLSVLSGTTPVWTALSSQKVLPMCLGESVTYVLECSMRGIVAFY